MWPTLKTQKHRGSIIAFTVILLSILLTAGLSVVTVAALEKKSGLSTQKSVVAFQAADSGTERVLKRIYIDNSPAFSQVPENGTMPDATIGALVSNLDRTVDEVCDTGRSQIRATSQDDPTYTFEVTFYDGTGAKIGCTDTTWRDKVIRIQTEGFFRQTSRVLDLGIKPRPFCSTSDIVTDIDGNTYGVLPLGDQCWLDRNMQVGSRIPSSTSQTDNSTIEYYCYDDDPDNCTDNHPNRPDGGLYTWDEAMQYETAERSQGICPDGWHIPTDNEWYVLENYLDSSINDPTAAGWRGTDGGTKLKPDGTSGFEFNLGGTTFSGSSSLRDAFGFVWSSSEETVSSNVWMRNVGLVRPDIQRALIPKTTALSVRCVMD